MRWILRIILRVGMELVMEKEQRYTRDLFLCYESFAKYYPSKSDEMYHALELALQPVIDAATYGFVESLAKWLLQEVGQRLDG